MKRHWQIALLILGAGYLLHPGVLAAEKKAQEPEKKKVEPAKPIIVNDELINADLKDKVVMQSYCKTYTFRMEKGKSYQIELSSSAFRAYLRLENSSGGQIATDFDRFGNNQSAFIAHNAPKTEDYQIIATTLNGGATGKFTLTVKESTGDEGKPIALKIEKGQAAYNGMLARTDPRYNGQKLHKLFTVQWEEGKTYQIDHKSRVFDAYLYLIGPDGNILAQDDDGGEGLNSRIVHRAGKAGEYRIVATSLGGAGVGQFEFSIRQTDAK